MTETSEQFRERMRREIKPVAIRGFLGWGNRKGGYEAYGPGGRWAPATTANKEGGDLLGDALEHAGAHEGATLLVIAVDRFGDTTVLDEIEAMVAGVAAGPQTTPPLPNGDRPRTLVLGIHFPDLDPETDPDTLADVVAGIVNAERERNGADPVSVDLFPEPHFRVVAAPTSQEDQP